jgi:carbonic anhydrase
VRCQEGGVNLVPALRNTQDLSCQVFGPGECLSAVTRTKPYNMVYVSTYTPTDMCGEFHGRNQIIVNGKNYSPIDIERAAEKAPAKPKRDFRVLRLVNSRA